MNMPNIGSWSTSTVSHNFIRADQPLLTLLTLLPIYIEHL